MLGFKLMIESQYSEKRGDDYSNLEDSMLEMGCTIMDLEDEVIQLEDMVTSWEDTVLKMQKGYGFLFLNLTMSMRQFGLKM